MKSIRELSRLGRRIARQGGRRIAFECKRFLLSRVYPPLKPACIVIGVQKGGTSALFQYLSHHPVVAPSKVKEINFFSCDLRYARGVSFYHAHFPCRTPRNARKVTLDVTPDYLAAASRSARRIYDYDPQMKLIALLRNPVARAHSAWQMYARYCRDNPRWFSGWVEMCEGDAARDRFAPRPTSFGRCFEDDIRDEIDAMDRGKAIEMPILPHGMYHRQLKIFLNFFPREQLLVLTSEEFGRDTIAGLRRIEDFVGLEAYSWRETQLTPHHVGEYSQAISKTAADLLKSFYREQNDSLSSLLDLDPGWR